MMLEKNAFLIILITFNNAPEEGKNINFKTPYWSPDTSFGCLFKALDLLSSFVLLFRCIFLKILFILTMILDCILLPHIWLPWNEFWAFWNILLCIVGRFKRGRVCWCGFGCNWHVSGESWHKMANRWQATGDWWQVTGDRWQESCHMWHVKNDMWHFASATFLRCPVRAPECQAHLMSMPWHERWHKKGDNWHMRGVRWVVTHDRCQVTHMK